MTILHALILGAIEGISEFLPISSTGHLILTAHVLSIPQTEFVKSFEIIIQLGSILAVVVLYWKMLLQSWDVILRVIAAFIPTAIVGFLLEKIIKNILFESIPTILWALFLGGIILIVFELLHTEKDSHIDELKKISYTQAVVIGLFQAIAVIPGVSRSAATIVGGLMLGLKRRTIVDFSFLLAIPTMIAATGLDIVKDAHSFSSSDVGILAVGFVTSFIVALLVIKWFLGYIKGHTFIPFGVYRIVVAAVFFLLLIQW